MSLAQALRVLVVDDEPMARELMAGYVREHEGLELAAEAASGWAALAAIEEWSPEVLLLDVEMPGLDGFGLLAELESRSLETPQVIFVTAFDRYAVRAFDEHAVDYLLKPVSQQRFAQAINKLRQQERRQVAVRPLLEDALHLPPQRLLVRDRGRIVAVPVSAVGWVEAEGNYVRIHAGPRKFLIEKTLTEIEELLSPRGFARVHRGAIVNLDRVHELRSLSGSRFLLQLDDGTELVVSRTYSPRFRNAVL